MTDLVERLRSSGADGDSVYMWNLCTKAADEIERLRQRLGGAEASAMSALQNLTGIGYVLGQQAGESALESAKRVAYEIERLRADAERYRWLRDHGVTFVICKYESGGPGEHDWCGWLPFDTRSTDAAIDAAMKGKK